MNWMSKTIVNLLTRNPEPTLEEEVVEEAKLLDRDILEKELVLIDARFKIDAQRAKRDHIANWLMRDTARDVKKT